MSIFSHIVQKRFSRVNEDIATDALAYLLSSNEAMRTAMSRLLQRLEPAVPPLRFRAQQSETGIRPDLWGFDGSAPRAFVENKFWAGLTDQQPIAYLQGLASSKEPSVLLVVAPAARAHTLWRELQQRLADAAVAVKQVEDLPRSVRALRTALGPVIALTSWDALLATLDAACGDDSAARNDLAQLRALCQASDDDAFLPLSKEELTDQRIPTRHLQLGRLVQEVTDMGVTRGVISLDGVRPQASWDRVGRYIRLPAAENVGVWYGIHFGYWKEHGTSPLWMLFTDSDFGQAARVRPFLEAWAVQRERVMIDRDFEIGLALPLATGEEVGLTARKLLGEIHSLASALSDYVKPA